MRTELIPVIHMLNMNQVFFNVNTCVDAGINKIFLINHNVSAYELLKCSDTVTTEYPDLWVGVNILGDDLASSIMSDLGIYHGLWSDQSITKEIAKRRVFSGTLFTGVAFKYQPQPANLQEACEEAKLYTDVVVTSGTGTGKETPVDKVVLMREYLGSHPLAIASGVSVDNVDQYKGLVNYLLVASSITDKDEIIDPDKLMELKNKL